MNQINMEMFAWDYKGRTIITFRILHAITSAKTIAKNAVTQSGWQSSGIHKKSLTQQCTRGIMKFHILMQEIYNVYFDVDRFGTMAKIILVDILNTEGAISELSQSMSASYESDKHGNACLGL